MPTSFPYNFRLQNVNGNCKAIHKMSSVFIGNRAIFVAQGVNLRELPTPKTTFCTYFPRCRFANR